MKYETDLQIYLNCNNVIELLNIIFNVLNQVMYAFNNQIKEI